MAALVARPRHGYDLRSVVEEMTSALVPADPGGLYRHLRRLEEEGLVTSIWSEGAHGPQQRQYQVTPEGVEVLHLWREHLRERATVLDSIVETIDGALGSHSPRRIDDESDPHETDESDPNETEPAEQNDDYRREGTDNA
ncbi:MAG: PadR family transcriptional regulator, regulatory protein PadR [Actinomycetota bacterium]|nr:PadR family transcriptional regulator, regulatory protein PadR [Actinomycetota bacterium]